MGFSWHPSIRISISKNSKIHSIGIVLSYYRLAYSSLYRLRYQRTNNDNMQTEEILENIPNDNLI